MKREVALIVFLLLILNISLIIAADPKVEKAYICLENKVIDKCSSLSLEDKIFSLLSLGECKQELIDSAKKVNGKPQCWPAASCDLTLTGKALYALEVSGYDTTESADWLLSQKMVPGGLNWFLQIECEKETSCDITYAGGSNKLSIGLDKKINSLTGTNCLSLAQQNYWLGISQSCQDKEYEILCNCQPYFLTNLLYKDQTSPTIYVSEKTHQAYTGGSTGELIESYCFKQGNSCSYEGSLWATFALDYAGYKTEVDAFIPYLIASASTNTKYLPEVFLYQLLGDDDGLRYKTEILGKQRAGKYWQLSSSNNKFYDTSLALYPFQEETFTQKTNAMNWLLTDGVQDSQGCWEGSIKNTAFILHSLWQNDRPIPECTQATELTACNPNNICTDRKCVPGCRNDTNCRDGLICATVGANKQCVVGPECSVDNEATTCGAGRICNASLICVQGCRGDSKCTNPGEICNIYKLCAPGCRSDTQCPIDGEICNTANLTCVQGCRINTDCPTTELPFCSSSNTCVACTNSSQCGAGKQCLGSTCVSDSYQCIGNSHCTNATKPICDQDTHSCVRCNYDADCGNSSLECNAVNNTCVVKPQCRYDSDCNILNETCNVTINKCVLRPQCQEDIDCVELGFDECQAGKCIKIPPYEECNATKTCATGYRCTADKACEPIPDCENNNNSQCQAGYECNDDDECIPIQSDTCQYDFECPGDEICNEDNECVSPGDNKPRCQEDRGYFCRGSSDCANDGGSDLSDSYLCNAPDKCCDVGASIPTCQELNGIICNSNLVCDGGTEILSYSDSRSGEFCCTDGGSCHEPDPTNSGCEDSNGICRSSCNTGEEEIFQSCLLSSDVCCVSETTPTTKKSNYLWLWIFLILIVLALLAFIFRNKLSILLMRLRSGKNKPMPFRPGLPPPTSSISQRLIPRRILPPSQTLRPPMRQPIQQRPSPIPPKKGVPEKPRSDLDDVLKKLKDMGK